MTDPSEPRPPRAAEPPGERIGCSPPVLAREPAAAEAAAAGRARPIEGSRLRSTRPDARADERADSTAGCARRADEERARGLSSLPPGDDAVAPWPVPVRRPRNDGRPSGGSAGGLAAAAAAREPAAAMRLPPPVAGEAAAEAAPRDRAGGVRGGVRGREDPEGDEDEEGGARVGALLP